MSSNKLEDFRRNYSYKELIKKHSLDEVGVWEIHGEDPNCDLGGSHHSPHLATVTGRLGDVVEAAVELPNFWTWGAGGDICAVKIISIDDLGIKNSLVNEKAKLEARIKEIETELRK